MYEATEFRDVANKSCRTDIFIERVHATTPIM